MSTTAEVCVCGLNGKFIACVLSRLGKVGFVIVHIR